MQICFLLSRGCGCQAQGIIIMKFEFPDHCSVLVCTQIVIRLLVRCSWLLPRSDAELASCVTLDTAIMRGQHNIITLFKKFNNA